MHKGISNSTELRLSSLLSIMGSFFFFIITQVRSNELQSREFCACMDFAVGPEKNLSDKPRCPKFKSCSVPLLSLQLPTSPKASSQYHCVGQYNPCFSLLLMSFPAIVNWLFCSDCMHVHFPMCSDSLTVSSTLWSLVSAIL